MSWFEITNNNYNVAIVLFSLYAHVCCILKRHAELFVIIVMIWIQYLLFVAQCVQCATINCVYVCVLCKVT